ncbi:hypothetical protein [Streptomyces sp. NBC_00691]|uniref:hypothetical protein n=1 Tax=Streptomyces sp. NBC_00691 TaxID=2903671 RepID=UPI002E301D56|nr:hypothetical protein [Streptomyces sp. NBC_00691]
MRRPAERLDADRTVPVDRLVDGLYEEQPRAGAVGALQAHRDRDRRLGRYVPLGRSAW